ncbi:MAG: cytochrome b N-terminal domain-containing protein [Chloroflexota bacterium]
MTADPAARQRRPSWIEQRTRMGPVINAAMHVRVPMSAKTMYFGGIAMFLFVIQAVTGTLLSLYYKPTPEAAYKSVQLITSDVNFGWLIRSIHHWAANLMILFVVLHLARVFMQAAYKYPRELTWVVGALLFMVTLGFGFTGYLLPWDQRAYWATVVGTEIAGSVPFVGETLLLMLRGGADVTGETMGRFFGIHVLVLPLSLAGLLGLHMILVHQLGLANPKRPEPRVPTKEFEEEPLRPFFPHYIVDELVAWYVLLAVLVVLVSVFPAGLEEQANPLQTPAHIKPEWYYLGVYELLKLVPRIIGILTPIVGIGLLVMWPFLDRRPEVRMRRRKLAVGGFSLIGIALVALTVWGYVS